MPRAGAAASRFDLGWEWTEPGDDPTGNGQGYYDWSQSGDFSERTRRATLRAIPSEEPSPRAAPAPAAARRPARRPVADAFPSPVAAPDLAPAPVPAVVSTAPPAPVRRTVTITGRGAEGHLPVAPRRPGPRASDRIGFNPDRIAMWAVLLGILMIVAAATSAHG